MSILTTVCDGEGVGIVVRNAPSLVWCLPSSENSRCRTGMNSEGNVSDGERGLSCSCTCSGDVVDEAVSTRDCLGSSLPKKMERIAGPV